jgi:hypothetical protein
MLLEDILLAAAIGIVVLVAGFPIYRFLRLAPWGRKDPLAEAQERLRVAMVEAEVARVNRETEKVYENLYSETLADDADERRVQRDPRARVVTDDEAAADEQATETEKGRPHGKG